MAWKETIVRTLILSARLEYETLFALGSLCGVSDPNVVLRAAALCDDLGMDAISAGILRSGAAEAPEGGTVASSLR